MKCKIANNLFNEWEVFINSLRCVINSFTNIQSFLVRDLHSAKRQDLFQIIKSNLLCAQGKEREEVFLCRAKHETFELSLGPRWNANIAGFFNDYYLFGLDVNVRSQLIIGRESAVCYFISSWFLWLLFWRTFRGNSTRESWVGFVSEHVTNQ